MTYESRTVSGTVRRLSFLALAFAALIAACDDNDPFAPEPWGAAPDTVVLYAANLPEYQGRPAAFDAIYLDAIPLETAQGTVGWDFALLSTEDGLRLAPAGSFDGITSHAGIAVESSGFEAVRSAPRDTAAYARTFSRPLRESEVYIIRSRRHFDAYHRSCSVYAKIQPLDIDEERGRFAFTFVRNPNCNDRSLVPTRS